MKEGLIALILIVIGVPLVAIAGKMMVPDPKPPFPTMTADQWWNSVKHRFAGAYSYDEKTGKWAVWDGEKTVYQDTKPSTD